MESLLQINKDALTYYDCAILGSNKMYQNKAYPMVDMTPIMANFLIAKLVLN